ncbi:hypothetical protein SAMN02910447_02571 [Ruminococcus sp. YE71]|uniref:HAD family hydrolase n=1 Tax=unclassified Ruminococcus TaxID=2608920 RepID=UPI00088D9532|nr:MULTISPECIES: HAD family hydrolase [unclassified Ruminococcus]SDA25138.1 hypothetical protein SAMN02910446_02489 [Ruminococcus sp. YE78]SFW42963.1 hypothetical protein SAMN02910447_02571 [Ruminococcus sp. YE71]
MKKIMFFDVDGTLIPEDGDHVVPESTFEALRLARKAGNLLFVNTGRTPVMVGEKIRSMGFDGFICGCGTYIECGGRELFYNRLSREFCLSVAETVRKYDGCPMYEHRGGIFSDPKTRRIEPVCGIHDSLGINGLSDNRTVYDDDFIFDKFVLSFDEKTDLEHLRPKIEEDFAWIERGETFAELVPKNCSKATGIDFVRERLGLERGQCYAIGDSLNDLPMFSAVGTSISMGNGEMLAPYADYVTDDIHADGLYKAMEHFGFFEE